jgi:hypothetical protein
MIEFVYFIRVEAPVEAQPVKVGRARDPAKRLTDLQCSSPWRLTMMRIVEGSLGLERMLHQFLAEDRMSGEWFRPSSRLDSLLALSDDEIHDRFGRPLVLFEESTREPTDFAAWLEDAQDRLARLRVLLRPSVAPAD